MDYIQTVFNYEDEFYGLWDARVGKTAIYFEPKHLETLVYLFLNDPWLTMELDFEDVLKLFGRSIFNPDFMDSWEFQFESIQNEFSHSEKFNPKFNIPKSKKTYLDFWVDLNYDEHPIYYASAILAAWGLSSWTIIAHEIISGWIKARRTPLFDFKTVGEAAADPKAFAKKNPAIDINRVYIVKGTFQDFEYLKGLPKVTPQFLEQFNNSIYSNLPMPCYN